MAIFKKKIYFPQFLADIVMGCGLHFHKKISSEEVGEAVSITYGKYLTEYKTVSKTLALKKIEKVMELLELCDKAKEKAKKHDEYAKKTGYHRPCRIDNDIDRVKFYLCDAFCDYCVGKDRKSENWDGRHFAAFKFARGFVQADVVTHALKQCSVTFR